MESSGGSGGDQLQPGVGDGGTPTEVVAEENMKILKQENKKIPLKKDGRRALGAGYHITTPDSWNPRMGVGSGQLKPGVEDGGTPTEVVEEKNRKIPPKGGP